jgi:hypothetical protein
MRVPGPGRLGHTFAPAPYLNDLLTVPTVLCRQFRGVPAVDVIFIITVVALYAVTHWVVRALSRLGGLE